MKKKVIFIDRDGVINKDLWKYVEHWGEFEFLPGVLGAFKLLAENDFHINIISNQAGVGDGKFTEEALADVNRNMISEIKKVGGNVDGTYYCLHGKQEGCSCRKPEIGLFEKAVQDIPPFEKSHTFFIGDKLTDIEAGKRFGLKTILVLTGYGDKSKADITEATRPDYICTDLQEAVAIVLGFNGKDEGLNTKDEG